MGKLGRRDPSSIARNFARSSRSRSSSSISSADASVSSADWEGDRRRVVEAAGGPEALKVGVPAGWGAELAGGAPKVKVESCS